MKFEISTKQLTEIKAQSLIVGLFEDGQFTETEVALDMAAKGLLSELAANKTFFNKEAEVIRFHRPEGLNVTELVVVNLGKIENFDDIAQAIAGGILDTLEYEGETDNAGEEGGKYRVQAGAYRNRTYAQRLMEELMDLDIPAYIDDSGPFYLVQVGEYTNLDEAAAMEQKIKRAGYPAVIVR